MGFASQLSSLARHHVSSLLLALVGAGAQTTLAPPGQPSHQGIIGGFELIGNSYVSAQQVSIFNICYFCAHRDSPAFRWHGQQGIFC